VLVEARPTSVRRPPARSASAIASRQDTIHLREVLLQVKTTIDHLRIDWMEANTTFHHFAFIWEVYIGLMFGYY